MAVLYQLRCVLQHKDVLPRLFQGFVAKENENAPLRDTLPASRVIYGHCWVHASLTDVKGSSPECLLIREGGKIQPKKLEQSTSQNKGGSLGSSSSAGSQDLLNYCHLPISQVSKHGEGEVKRCSRLHLLTDF